MELSEKDSAIWKLKEEIKLMPTLISEVKENTGKTEKNNANAISPHKFALFAVKKVIEKIPQSMIKNLYANIDKRHEEEEDEEEEKEINSEDELRRQEEELDIII